MTEAIKYMHTSHPPILHRDLKSRNVFISFQDVKIGDLGVSRVLQESFAKVINSLYLRSDLIESRYCQYQLQAIVIKAFL